MAFCSLLYSSAWSRTSNEEDMEMGSMGKWKLHLTYSNPTELAASSNYIYAQAQGAVFYMDRATDQLVYLSKATGLKGNTVAHIAYDKKTEQLVIAYEDGRMDLLDKNDNVRQMPDLQLKAGSLSIDILCISPGSRYTYIGTSFGILAINTKKAEVADTYYIGENATTVAVKQIAELGDSLYAFSNDTLYTGHMQDNLANYIFWHKEKLPFNKMQQAAVWHNQLYVLCDNRLYRRHEGRWERALQQSVQWIHANDGQLLLYSDAYLYRMKDAGEPDSVKYQYKYAMNDAIYANGEYWAAETNQGLLHLNGTEDEWFHTEGPNSNAGYCMYTMHDQLYTSVGGRWDVQWGRPGRINIYNGATWRCIDEGTIADHVSTHYPPRDISSLAIDPQDPGHFYAATYGNGVYEFHNYGEDSIRHFITDTIKHTNTLREAIPKIDIWTYTRTDGAMMDEQGNFWVLNATDVGYPLHIVTPDGKWHAIPLRDRVNEYLLTTPKGIWTDRRNKQCKWIMDQRYSQGLFLIDDGGTPSNPNDDQCMKRAEFIDQNGNQLMPEEFLCWAQDRTNRVWIGTNKGLFTLDANTDFFKTNACRRIIIPRNDGTGLGDYLLGSERINCIAADGGNRIWIGTDNSGLYLIEDDTITVAHFTENNSVLPSNTVQSIAIMPRTGEVFVGTDKGIASYRSDASEPQPTMSGAYAYPNPVRPDYGGLISITGLTENTTVNILDSGGNLVCKTRSNGGTAVWDGKLADGRRATPGVYTALCNSTSGHTAVKILVIR